MTVRSRAHTLTVLFPLLITLILVHVCGCGGGSNSPGSIGLCQQAINADPVESRSVADVLAEVDAAQAPSGVDGEVFGELKAELKRVLSAREVSEIPVSPPTGEKNKVTDLEVVFPATGNYRLEWTYVNVGDYNQDKLVGVSDLTPVGVHFDKGTASPDWATACLADGIADGLITVSDITPIGQNFNVRTAGYDVQRADNETGPWSTVYTVDFGEPGGNPFKRFMYMFTTLDVAYYRVVPTDGTTQGEPSNVVMTPGELVAPDITDVQPQGGVSGGVVTLTATVTGSEPLDYAWNFGGGATPNTSTEAAPEITLGAVGEYGATLVVTNDADSDEFLFTLAVSSTGEPVITGVSPMDGFTGDEVTFSAAYTADGTPAFAWNFGGGATPNTSAEESPQVELGAAGMYNASITITNEAGSDEFPFTLTIAGVDPPEITNVLPTSGDSGANVSFTPIFTSGGTPDFNWDFGGGATPNTSSIHNPLVTLGAAGEYAAEVEIIDEYGNFTFPFTLTVNLVAGPANVTDVQPRWGITGTELTLSAAVTGTEPISYAWDFGGGAAPNTSGNAAPTVTLGAAGVYGASLIVSNAGGSDELDFALYVSESSGMNDMILAIPQAYDVFAGQSVPISVECFNTASPFYDLKGVRVTFNTGCEYRNGSFNCGSFGGGRDTPDGPIWTAVAPTQLLVPEDSALQSEIDLGGGRSAIDFWIQPQGGGETALATGELFNFQLNIDGDCPDGEQIIIGIERLDGPLSKTYYAEADATEHFWADDDNDSIPAIDACHPAFTLTDPPASGDGTAASPYVVANDQVLHFQVTTVKWGDVTADPRTTYHLTPDGSGTITTGTLTIDSEYMGGLAVIIDFDGYYSDWWYFEVPIQYKFGPDALIAVPSKTTAAEGEHVVITVYMNETANAFWAGFASVKLELGNNYVQNSFNVGAPGGHQLTPDGAWPPADPDSFIFLVMPMGDIGGGLQQLECGIVPVGGNEFNNGSGALFNFEIEIHSDVTLNFLSTAEDGTTGYQDYSMTNHYWSDISNVHPGVPNSITMIPPP